VDTTSDFSCLLIAHLRPSRLGDFMRQRAILTKGCTLDQSGLIREVLEFPVSGKKSLNSCACLHDLTDR